MFFANRLAAFRTLYMSTFKLSVAFLFFFCLRMWRKSEAKEPQTPHPWESGHMPSPPPKMRESRYFKPQPHPTMWLRRGPGCRRPGNP